MNQAVFISDLHLHPKNAQIHQRFERFVDWAKTHTQSLYILGDFVHVWAGDDLMDDYALQIIALLESLYQAGVAVYFMPGNRDFLIGDTFLKKAHMIELHDPSVVLIDDRSVYLTHGDKYCTSDRAHQFLRLLTRNVWFKFVFLKLPASFRKYLVQSVRSYSQQKKKTPRSFFPIDIEKLFQDMLKYQVMTTIYGHVHQCAHHIDNYQNLVYQRYVLSDWDHQIKVLCYSRNKGFEFQKI